MLFRTHLSLSVIISSLPSFPLCLQHIWLWIIHQLCSSFTGYKEMCVFARELHVSHKFLHILYIHIQGLCCTCYLFIYRMRQGLYSEGVVMIRHPESFIHTFLFGTAGMKGVADETETHAHIFSQKLWEQPRWRVKRGRRLFKFQGLRCLLAFEK